MLTLGPDTPPGLRPLLTDISEALRGLKAPAMPSPVYACASTALPPAADWPRCVLLVTNLNILAHSDGSNWIRQDTGGVI
jgi:hypothetical protein